MSFRSEPELLALHGVRVLGSASARDIAARYQLLPHAVSELLLDYEAQGWVTRVNLPGVDGWSITDRGRAENERRLASELDSAGARATVTEAHAAFRPLNERFSSACTRWQIRPIGSDTMHANDHTDWRWDERVLRELSSLDSALRGLCSALTAALARFSGYSERYSAALSKVVRGERSWLDAPDRASCQIVWIQFHEDLLATLGIPRGADH